MKEIKKLAGLALAAVLVTASITGCGGKASGGKDTYVIGSIGPITGENASYGLSVKQGAEIAVKEINDAGGVKVGDKTLTFDFKFEDDEAAPDKAVNAYNSLMDDGMNALLGCVTTSSCLSVADISKEDGILMLTPSGSAQDITKNDNVFRLCFTDPLQGITMAEHLITKLGYKDVAVIYKNSDAYSTGIYETFVEKVKELGGNIATVEAFADGEDFNTQLTSIKGTNAQAIFAPMYYNDAAHIAMQAADMGMKLPFYGSDGWDGIADVVTNPAAIEGAVFLSPFFSGDEAAADFVKKYQDAYNAVPDQFAADGYDCVYVLKAALETAKSVDNDAVIKAMTEISVDGLTGTGISFTAEGEPQKAAKFITIRDGANTIE